MSQGVQSHPFPPEVLSDLRDLMVSDSHHGEGAARERQLTQTDRLLVRALEKDPAIAVVHPDDILTIDINPNTALTFFTYGLGCCTSTMLVTRDRSGMTRATLAHFGPDANEEHAQKLQQEAAAHLAGGRKIEAARLFIILRTDMEPLEGRMPIEEAKGLLEGAAALGLGSGIELGVKTLGYDLAMTRGCGSAIFSWPGQHYRTHGQNRGEIFAAMSDDQRT